MWGPLFQSFTAAHWGTSGPHSAGLIHVFLTTSGNALVIMGMLGERMDQQKSRALRNSPPAMTKLFIAHLQRHTVCIGPGVFHTCVHTRMHTKNAAFTECTACHVSAEIYASATLSIPHKRAWRMNMGDCASDVRLMGHVQLLWDKILVCRSHTAKRTLFQAGGWQTSY